MPSGLISRLIELCLGERKNLKPPSKLSASSACPWTSSSFNSPPSFTDLPQWAVSIAQQGPPLYWPGEGLAAGVHQRLRGVAGLAQPSEARNPVPSARVFTRGAILGESRVCVYLFKKKLVHVASMLGV